jgi:branched-chain amino acid transport system ATP-binding protein
VATASVLRCEGVSVRFGGLTALRELDLAMAEGGLLGMIGPNGSGKTTLINAVTGLVPLTSGAIWFGERRVDGLRPFELARLGIARTFQIMRPFTQMTVLENLIVPAVHAAGDGDLRRARRRAEEELAFVGLGDRAGALPGELSLPDRKRLELAKALARRPRLLFLDEVNAGLNPREVETMMGLLRLLNARGLTIVVVEHVMRVIAGLCTRVVVLHHGECIADGPCEAITSDPRVIQAYLGVRFAERWAARGAP